MKAIVFVSGVHMRMHELTDITCKISCNSINLFLYTSTNMYYYQKSFGIILYFWLSV